MGLFRRRRSGDGLYRGDAPVSQPGWQGESPTAYQSAAHRPGEPVLERADQDRHRPYAAEPDSSWAAADSGAAATPGPADRPRRRLRTVGWLSILGVGAILLVGFAGYSILAAVQSALPSAQQAAPPAPRPTVDEVIDVPVTTSYGGQHIEIVVLAAQRQPVTGWGLPARSPDPHLVISVTLEHLGTDPAPITIPFFDWTFTPSDEQAPVPVTLVSGFEPALGSPALSPGNPVSGLLVFQTAAAEGTLVLHPLLTPVPLVRWSIRADTATVVPGAIGQPAQAQVGRPPFTVTLNAAARLEPGAAVIGEQPAAGGYLVADLTVSAADPTSSGVINAESFVFVPTGGTPVGPTDPAVVMGTTATVPIVGGSSSPVVLAFDVPAGPGTLELQDRSGNPMIAWPVP
jgi:hypothetical protein